MKDKDYKGEDYLTDTNLKDGPLQNRGCTDILFILIFAVFAAGYFYTDGYAGEHGRPR